MLQQIPALDADPARSASGNVGDPPPLHRRMCWGLYATAAVMLLLAQLSNPLAAVIPAMAFVLDWLVLRRPLRTAARWALPLLGFAMIDAIICKMVQPGTAAPYVSWWVRPLVATDTLAFYLSKLFFPLHLCTEYGRRPDVALARGWLYWTWILPAAVACIVLVMCRRRPIVIAGALIALIGVAPVLGLICFDMQQFSTPADRYLYLAMLGPALLMCAWFASRRPVWQWVVFGCIIAVLSAKSFVQCGTWRDDMTLWQHTIALSPDSYVAHINLGADYNRLGDERGPLATHYLTLAMAEYEKAVRINPDFFKVRDNLASVYVRLGMIDEAIIEMKAAMRLQDRLYTPSPRERAQARIVLAAALLRTHRSAEAMAYLNEAGKLDPLSPGLEFALMHARKQISSPAIPSSRP